VRITVFNNEAKLVFCGKRDVRPKREIHGVEEEFTTQFVNASITDFV
jgi:hypothetical protein